MQSSKNSSFLANHIQRFLNIGIIFLAGYISLHFRFGQPTGPNDFYDKCIYGACLIFLFLSSVSQGQTRRNHHNNQTINAIKRISKLWVISFIAIVLVLIFTQSGNLVSRIWLLLWAFSTWILLIALELFFEFGLTPLLRRNIQPKRVALIGSGIVANDLVKQLKNNAKSEYVLALELANPKTGDIESLGNQILDEIWIALPIHEANQLPTIIQQLRFSAANIKYVPDLFTFRLINHGSSAVLGVQMLNLNSSPFTGENLILKSIEDFMLSLAILICISPLLLFVAIAVKLTSPGPIFYRQERVGLNGKPFMMLKFRSMPVDIEKDGAHWGGSDNKVAHPLAKWMRRLNLDELPQFINVLKGEMSIVGPRPERTEFIGQFRDQIPNYMKKHLVKAGITGWAQVHGLRGDTDLYKRVEYDLFYIENWSLWLDIKIILMTAIQTLQSRNTST
ncbi:undecaprenyl-phosphate glucose phosphotransferase [Polynucleobacter sp. Tro8-14-1]|uniref:undecaprenyl-phosphate glucose phosphotransferase n=1 Tax=Polynucleobacter sp. Tro8-14-1 TaxID=1758383 RepID=UPI001C0B3937|nr:undecaprenyl-phosphate glucose phosphotransferase [Polynucleobacter sp. Tro8-14-1]MBU3563614.1 undecaprenyl-phosphate glucose phosphotransferase [Polynucleobacter sp. Tro8-14-1]